MVGVAEEVVEDVGGGEEEAWESMKPQVEKQRLKGREKARGKERKKENRKMAILQHHLLHLHPHRLDPLSKGLKFQGLRIGKQGILRWRWRELSVMLGLDIGVI